MKAENVLQAALKTFMEANSDESYHKSKANMFLARCGAAFDKYPEQQLEEERIMIISYAMMDRDTKAKFWQYLRELEEARP